MLMVESKFREILDNLPSQLEQQRVALNKILLSQGKFCEAIPNNYSFLVYPSASQRRGQTLERALAAVEKQAENYQGLNRLNQELFSLYRNSEPTRPLNHLDKSISDELINKWQKDIANGNYFLTWQAYLALEGFYRLFSADVPVKILASLSQISEVIFSEWEISFAIAQAQVPRFISRIQEENLLSGIQVDRLEVGKVLKGPTKQPAFPTFKIILKEDVLQEDVVELSNSLAATLIHESFELGTLPKENFGFRLRPFLRIQNGFGGLKSILNSLKKIDDFYFPDFSYAYLR